MGLKFGQTEKFKSIFRFAAVRYYIFNCICLDERTSNEEDTDDDHIIQKEKFTGNLDTKTREGGSLLNDMNKYPPLNDSVLGMVFKNILPSLPVDLFLPYSIMCKRSA